SRKRSRPATRRRPPPPCARRSRRSSAERRAASSPRTRRRVACRVSTRASKRWLDATSLSEMMNAAPIERRFCFLRRAEKISANYFWRWTGIGAWLAIGRIPYDSLLSEHDDARALDIEPRHRSTASAARQRIEARGYVNRVASREI